VGVAISLLRCQGDPARKTRGVRIRFDSRIGFSAGTRACSPDNRPSSGNIAEAKKKLRAALQLAPNDADAQNALAMLESAHEQQVK